MEMQCKQYLVEEEYFLEDDQNDDALSFCDLPLNDEAPSSDVVSRPSSPFSDAFEFSIAEAFRSTDQTILFCGKSIPCQSSATAKTTSYSQWKSESFHYDELRSTKASEIRVHVTTRSSSVRLPETGKCRYPYQSSGYNTGGSRKHYKVLIGLAKLPPRMELDDMRRRQSRRMAVVAGGEKLPAVAGGGSSGKGHLGNFVRALRFRSKLVSALARVSFGCVRPVCD